MEKAVERLGLKFSSPSEVRIGFGEMLDTGTYVATGIMGNVTDRAGAVILEDGSLIVFTEYSSGMTRNRAGMAAKDVGMGLYEWRRELGLPVGNVRLWNLLNPFAPPPSRLPSVHHSKAGDLLSVFRLKQQQSKMIFPGNVRLSGRNHSVVEALTCRWLAEGTPPQDEAALLKPPLITSVEGGRSAGVTPRLEALRGANASVEGLTEEAGKTAEEYRAPRVPTAEVWSAEMEHAGFYASVAPQKLDPQISVPEPDEWETLTDTDTHEAPLEDEAALLKPPLITSVEGGRSAGVTPRLEALRGANASVEGLTEEAGKTAEEYRAPRVPTAEVWSAEMEHAGFYASVAPQKLDPQISVPEPDEWETLTDTDTHEAPLEGEAALLKPPLITSVERGRSAGVTPRLEALRGANASVEGLTEEAGKTAEEYRAPRVPTAEV
uniref:Uncharacterized protein n=1 Tax=Chromera velia CCMP2878 TaxID=1169474 RepID=A0A0G4H9X0_9ALVE|eukprot:Cvel_888.t1-p1 / transcript=Cvel_888.t1 / gene=Cvel_888 / organism=Chromera_velia_CCMP2878 / gene_product=hypothetical protein / transcript_product=hypothetical protein / location=Cvel_scaffold28:51178-54242(-) / protein_length=435 / sequence_SO=supercontig / SO=protein_coding / is_pseudo=false